MAETYNSISSQLSQLYSLLQSSLESLNKINLATTSTDDFVEIEIPDLDGNVEKYRIPSFNFLKKETERLEGNLNRLAGLDSDSQIKLADGTLRKVYTAKIPKSPDSIKEVLANNSFGVENNWFFESFMTPSVYLNLEVPAGLDASVKKVKVQRIILDIENQDQVDFFEENINNKNDINRNTLLETLNRENISYFIDDNINDLPIIENRFYGKFSVIRKEANLEGNLKRYKLDKLTYSDKSSDTKDTIGLKIGDNLALNESTRYEVVNIDSSTNTVDLKLIEGYGSIPIGADILEILKLNTSQKFIKVGFGYNERQVIFIKPINYLTNLEADFWSPGVGVFSNNLEINFQGDLITFENFYKTQVSDFGSLLLGLSKDNPIPSVLAVKPEPPQIENNYFKVVLSNSHLRSQAIENIENLNSEKENLQAEIKNLDTSIAELRKIINNKTFSNETEQNSDKANLIKLEQDRENKNAQFSNIVESILENNMLLNVDSFKPRYRIRGFFPIPNAKESKLTKNQEVIAFEYEYRYLNVDGSSKINDQFKVGNSNDRAVFSNWTRVRTKSRDKVLNPQTNNYEFITESVDSSEEININQVDIPIQPNEIVQLRVRSISEAGFPQNPVYSDFSDIVTINFPEELIQQNITSEIVRQTEQDKARLKLEQSLSNLGVNEHVADSFTINNKFFAHNAINLNSGFVTPEQQPITIFDKLQELEKQINLLNEKVNRAKGTLKVTLLDEEGGETIISNNTDQKVFSGYYQNEVADLTIKKGAIVTKTYFLVIENVGSNDLEFLSFYPSVSAVDPNTDELGVGLNPTNPTSPNFTLNYSSVQYADAPIFDSSVNPVGDSYDYQKKQEYGQFLYNRKIALDGRTELYKDGDIIEDSSFSATSPIIPTGTNWVYDVNGNLKTSGVDKFSDLGVDIHEEYFNFNSIPVGTPVGVKISDKIKEDVVSASYNSTKNLPIGFRNDDQFLIGPKSCGAYLFLQTNDIDNLKISGNQINSIIKVPSGRESSIRIPIRFQFRMTDFYGSGTTGTGNIDGDLSGSTKNITYTKKLAFDLLFNNNEKFSFDLTFLAKYRSDGATILETNKFSETLIRRNFFARDVQKVLNANN